MEAKKMTSYDMIEQIVARCGLTGGRDGVVVEDLGHGLVRVYDDQASAVGAAEEIARLVRDAKDNEDFWGALVDLPDEVDLPDDL